MPERTDRLSVIYSVIFESAFHCGTGLPRQLIDRSIQRDRHENPIVPGSTVKGALRDRCESLAALFGLTARSPHDLDAARADYDAPDMIARIFGSRVHPGGLFFDDLRLTHTDRVLFERTPSFGSTVRTQVSLSRRTGAARPKFLFSSEYGPPGVTFEGKIHGHATGLPVDVPPDSPTYTTLLLVAGLLALDRLGGSRSAGAGRCRSEINTIKVNGESCDYSPWLDRLADLEYADLAWAEVQA